MESCLQNEIFVYKKGKLLTKWDFHLQNGILTWDTGILVLQMGMSDYNSPTLTASDCFSFSIIQTMISSVL